MRTLIRIAQGLPPTDAIVQMSVGNEQIDASINRLLDHARISGSVFSVLQGEYGSGKTHLLLHLADRACRQGHPVFRLNLERLNFDLGNPARHLHRMLDDSQLPASRRPSALEWLSVTTRDPSRLQRLLVGIRSIARETTDAGAVARRALRICDQAADPGRALEAFLAARDLAVKPGAIAHRRDAYGRLLLWIELLQRLERWRGPVLLIDEAENLYSTGVTRAARRTALRSLAFYCGGTLPSACVVMTSTPRALGKLKYEARQLLWDVDTQTSALDWEDTAMLRYRLLKLQSERVPALTAQQRVVLAERVVLTHRQVRGVDVPFDIGAHVERTESPRHFIRRLVDELEAEWWRVRTTVHASAESAPSVILDESAPSAAPEPPEPPASAGAFDVRIDGAQRLTDRG